MRTALEELLLVVLALCMLSYLIPMTFASKLITTAVIAFGLIALLILRSLDWHSGGSTPFDWVIIAGVLLSLVHLASFAAFAPSLLGMLLIIAFAAYYLIMAFLLAQHRWLFKPRG